MLMTADRWDQLKAAKNLLAAASLGPGGVTDEQTAEALIYAGATLAVGHSVALE